MTIHGIQYKSGFVVRLQDISSSSFKYGIIDVILVYEGQKIFVTKVLKTESFHKSLCAIQVTPTDTIHYVQYNQLYCHGVVPLHKKLECLFVIEKNYCFKDLLCLF